MIYSENSCDKITATTITTNKEGALSICPTQSVLGTSMGRTWPLEQRKLGSYFSSAPPVNTFTGKQGNFSEPQFLPPQMEIKMQMPTRDFSSLWGGSTRADSQRRMKLSLCMLQDSTSECAWTQSLDQLWQRGLASA